MFFEGFGDAEVIDVAGEPIRLRRAGSGPALLLLHGHPQTHAMWHSLAPRLIADHTVLVPDLPGYGGSRAGAGANALPGTKDSMARRMFGLLDALGVERVSVFGHDRGGRVAHRMAVGWPERVERLGLLDVVPVPETVEREDMAFALATYRMFWFAQTHPKPESLFHEEPKIWLPGVLPGAEPHAQFHPEAVADYLAGIADTEAMAALNEEYRVAIARDLVEERNARLGSLQVACPMLVLWGASGRIGGWYDPIALWQERSSCLVTGAEIDAGHYLVEEQPETVAAAMIEFLQRQLNVSHGDVS